LRGPDRPGPLRSRRRGYPRQAVRNHARHQAAAKVECSALGRRIILPEVPSHLRAVLVRLGVLAAGLAGIVGVAVLNRFAHLGLAPTLLLEYVAVTCVIWGLNGFLFRTVPLSGLSLLVFSAAAFGVLFLVAYFVGAIVAPLLFDAAGQFIGLVHLTDFLFYAFALMTIAGAAGCAFSRNIIYFAWALLFAFLGVAGLYVFLAADFPAVAQGLIYVGGILVLILFAIMLTKQIGGDPSLTNAHLGLPIGAALAAATVGTLAYMAVLT